MADSVVPEATQKESFWRRRVTSPLLALLRQGATPDKLALAVAIGFVLGVFPILGTTTLLCVLVAATLRVNQVATQVGNGLAYPFLFILIIPFVRLGEWISGDLPFPLEIQQMKAAAHDGFVAFLWTFSDGSR